VNRTRTRLYRAAGLAALIAVVAALANAPWSRPWMLNVSASMPEGLYEVRPIDRKIERGDAIVICAPPKMAALARARGYLGPGPCPQDAMPLLKFVAAVGGDVVDVSARAIAVDRRCLPSGVTYDRDGAGRPLPHVARGRYRLAPNQLWLWAPAPQSFDSRYFGPVDARDVTKFAKPVFLWAKPEVLSFGSVDCVISSSGSASSSGP